MPERARRLAAAAYPLASAALLLGAWWFVASRGWFPPHVLPSPEAVLNGTQRIMSGYMGGDVVTHVWASLKVVLGSYLLAIAVGFPLGVLMAWYRVLDVAFSPLIAILRPVPPPAWIPLAILWFGIGLPGKVFVCFVAAFVPVIVNSYLAIREVRPELIAAARTLGASRTRLLFEVAIPSGLPVIMTGFRIALGIAWATIVAAELVVATAGLGYLIMNGYRNFESEIMAGAMIAIAVIGIAMNAAFMLLERRLVAWADHD